MTDIIFESMTLSGFKSFIKPITFNLNQGPGVHFIHGQNKVDPDLGSNGSGKSTLWDGLCWVLYGRTASGLRNPDIKPWYGTSETKGTIKLSVEQTSYSIARTMGPNILLLDNREVGQENINQLVGMEFEVFCHVILFGQDRPLFFDLSPQEKLSLLSNVIDLSRWEEWSDKAAARTTELLNKKIGLEGRVASMGSQSEELKDMITATLVRSRQWEKERTQRVDDTDHQIATLKPKLEVLQKKRDNADLALEGASTELRAIPEQVRKITSLLNTVNQNIREFEDEERLHNMRIANIQDELDRLGSSDRCPTCGQNTKGTQLQKHRLGLLSSIKQMKKSKIGVPARTLQLQQRYKKALEQLEEARQKFQEKADEAQASLNLLQRQVSEMEGAMTILKEASKNRIAEANPHRETIRDLKTRRRQLFIDIKDQQKKIALTERRAKRTHSWVKGFKEVRLYIIKEILQELELATMAMLPSVGLHDWQVRYDIEKENKTGGVQRKLNVELLSPDNKKTVRWESWSGGEGQRLRLVGSMALAEVLLNNAGIRTNLEILDEPTKHLSTEGVRDLCEFLADRAEQSEKAIFFVDHMAVDSARFASTTQIVKTKKGSRIVA